jgi:hypothetical protein
LRALHRKEEEEHEEQEREAPRQLASVSRRRPSALSVPARARAPPPDFPRGRAVCAVLLVIAPWRAARCRPCSSRRGRSGRAQGRSSSSSSLCFDSQRPLRWGAVPDPPPHRAPARALPRGPPLPRRCARRCARAQGDPPASSRATRTGSDSRGRRPPRSARPPTPPPLTPPPSRRPRSPPANRHNNTTTNNNAGRVR